MKKPFKQLLAELTEHYKPRGTVEQSRVLLIALAMGREEWAAALRHRSNLMAYQAHPLREHFTSTPSGRTGAVSKKTDPKGRGGGSTSTGPARALGSPRYHRLDMGGGRPLRSRCSAEGVRRRYDSDGRIVASDDIRDFLC